MLKTMYFDNNATTHMLPQVKLELIEAISTPLGNSESNDTYGIAARLMISEARNNVASLLKSNSERIVFTSSASEANCLAIYSAIHSSPRKRIVSSQIEHSSIANTLALLSEKGFDLQFINTLSSGQIDLKHAKSLINKETCLVVTQHVNNETGVIQPVQSLAQIAHSQNSLFHCDGAQAFGKIDFNVNNLGCDFFSFSAHKIHGPAGIGGLWIKEGAYSMHPLILGGSQEFGVRGGTHNLLGIIGFSAATKERIISLQYSISQMRELRDLFETELLKKCPGIKINGHESPRVCNTTNVQFTGINGKALYLRLQQKGICCSQKSACTSQFPEPSTVLRAMGLTYEEAFNSIRFSFSELNTLEEILAAVEIIFETYNYLLNFR